MGKNRKTKGARKRRPSKSKSVARRVAAQRKAKARPAKRVARPKMGRKKHPDHLRTETIGFALYEADKKTLLKGCKLRGISKSSAFRLSIRLWEKNGFKLDARAVQDKVRGNKDPIRMAREAANAKRRTAKKKNKAPRAPKAPAAPTPMPQIPKSE